MSHSELSPPLLDVAVHRGSSCPSRFVAVRRGPSWFAAVRRGSPRFVAVRRGSSRFIAVRQRRAEVAPQCELRRLDDGHPIVVAKIPSRDVFDRVAVRVAAEADDRLDGRARGANALPIMNGWLGCFIGIAIGCAGALVWQRYKGSDPELLAARKQSVTETREYADTLENNLEKCTPIREQLAALEIENQDLQRQLKGMPLPLKGMPLPPTLPTTSSSTTPGPGGLVAPPPITPAMARSFRERRFKDEAERLKRRLLLTVEQSRKLDRILEERLNAPEAPSDFNLAFAPWLKDELGTLLTPEQKTQYETIQQKELQGQTDMSARFELNQLEQATELTETQRQALLPILTEQARTMIQSGPPVPDSEDGLGQDPLVHMRAHMDRRLEAVAGVLTAPQLEDYRKHLTVQLEGMAAMMKAQESNSAPPQAKP